MTTTVSRLLSHLVWVALLITLVAGYVFLLNLVVKQAQDSYAECRAQDTIYQTNRRLTKALFEAYVIQIAMAEDQLNHPLPPPRRSY